MTARRTTPWISFVAVAILSVSAAEQDDEALFEPKPYELSGDMELWPTLTVFDRSSAAYTLKYPASGPDFSDAYNGKAELRGQYRFTTLLAKAEAMVQAGYERYSDSIEYITRFNECYVKWSPSDRFSVIAGKQLYLWGKGSLYNPVAFAGRQKDINDISAALEGYWGVSIETVRSFNGPLAALSMTAALLPVYGKINRGYAHDSSLAGIAQVYALFFDTDIDLCLYADNRSQIKAGLDFSRNIVPSWEVHGEWAWNREHRTGIIETGPVCRDSILRNTHDIVLGTRWLAPSNTTFILDYFHLGNGHSPGEMDAYYSAMKEATSGIVSSRTAVQKAMTYYTGQFVMTDYLYCKASHPEPFTMVYFTPSVYTLVNINDRSLLSGVELSYTRFNHATFIARYMTFIGKNNTEYGEKMVRHRIEARTEFAF
jgi:hypothetical protein